MPQQFRLSCRTYRWPCCYRLSSMHCCDNWD